MVGCAATGPARSDGGNPHTRLAAPPDYVLVLTTWPPPRRLAGETCGNSFTKSCADGLGSASLWLRGPLPLCGDAGDGSTYLGSRRWQ